MEQINWIALLVAALVPLIVGMIWYSQKGFGSAWMKAADISADKMQGANMPLIFGLVYLLSFFMALSLNFVVIHQMHLFSVLADEPGVMDKGSEVNAMLTNFMDKYGNNFRTFKHGAFHGFLNSITFALPIVSVAALFERRGAKYIAIHAGYWAVTMAIMGGIICQWR